MSDIKNKLIKIAYENPELRGDLLPIISGLDKEAAGGIMQRMKELFTSTKNAPKPHIFTSKDLGLELKDKEIEKFNHSFNVAVKSQVKGIKIEVLNKVNSLIDRKVVEEVRDQSKGGFSDKRLKVGTIKSADLVDKIRFVDENNKPKEFPQRMHHHFKDSIKWHFLDLNAEKIYSALDSFKDSFGGQYPWLGKTEWGVEVMESNNNYEIYLTIAFMGKKAAAPVQGWKSEEEQYSLTGTRS
jgi:hypothetical protein